jgi:hypothetical protein
MAASWHHIQCTRIGWSFPPIDKICTALPIAQSFACAPD